ncbi:MAG: signal peptidase I [Oscillospiraceae bacterium]|jgi:signal peptidase I|nr:signal peptidase I [Oscillospiraceae bacterium]
MNDNNNTRQDEIKELYDEILAEKKRREQQAQDALQKQNTPADDGLENLNISDKYSRKAQDASEQPHFKNEKVSLSPVNLWESENIDNEPAVIDMPDDSVKIRSDKKAKKEKKEKKESKRVYSIYDMASVFISAVVIILILFTFFFRFVGVVGESMVPTLDDGDWLLVSQKTYSPENGDIVVISQPNIFNENIVKRVVAIGGQTIDIDFTNGLVFVDGAILEETYLNGGIMENGDVNFPLYIPQGYLFVMGDNRAHSTDSRSSLIGLVREEYVLGRVAYGITGEGFTQLSGF